MRRFGSAFHVGMNGASAGRKILSLLNIDEYKWNEDKLTSYDIKINDLTFTYDGTRDVLKNINMGFNKGLNSIVGESGCGKSTIVKLITGSERSNIGSITIGNKELESLSRVDYYNHLSVVSYDSYIFNESILDNFKNAKLDVTEDEIWASLKLVNLDKFIKDNGGLDKVINEDSTNISGGERQRLSLAISLVTNKDIYIFDEATSNIDIESEKIIMDNIKELSKDKVVILISHRLKNVIESDNIYYLEDGLIKESGNHNELLKLNGGYNKLFNTQKALEEGFKDGDLNA
jgi:ATP-binding cassette subfamily C protein